MTELIWEARFKILIVGNWIKAFQSVVDIVVVLVCPIHTNPDVNISQECWMQSFHY